ncbi:hypothetical protein [Burkholderia pseudomultivorans]|uniref:OmpA-like domain-containing protein n=1 Tax=Burkholderia cenocepacia TaxID=95486 RepID=A0AAN0RX99_9BURK|nr:hypothetical protein [Burkholderia pseudomultivorans]AIO35865.1 hypothetical protein DM39_3835 [Burkholderia cenocepacia]
METKLLAVLALAFIGMQTALACDGPKNLSGQYIDVRFESDSSEIPVTELARLSVWSHDLRSRFPIIDLVWTVGLSEPTEKDTRRLAYRRAQNVMNALDQFAIRGKRSALIGRVYKPIPEIEETGRRVEVNVGPGCPDDCCANPHTVP